MGVFPSLPSPTVLMGWKLDSSDSGVSSQRGGPDPAGGRAAALPRGQVGPGDLREDQRLFVLRSDGSGQRAGFRDSSRPGN